MKIPILSSILITLLVLLSGCVTAYDTRYYTVEEYAARVEKSTDEFTGLVKIDSPRSVMGTGVLDVYWFSARKSKGSTNYTIYLYTRTWRSSYWGWAFFEQLYDKLGTNFKTIQVDREVENGGTTEELLATIIPQQYMVAWLDDPNPREFMLRGDNARYNFKVYPKEIQGFWDAFLRLR